MDIKQITQRRGSGERPRPAAPPTAQEREPDQGRLRALVGEIAAAPTRLGIDPLARDDGATLEVVVDPDAVPLGRTYRRILQDDPDVTPETAAILGPLEQDLARQQKIVAIADAADQLEQDLADTDRWAAQKEQASLGAFYRVLGGLIDGTLGGLPPEQRDQVRRNAREVLALREEEQAEIAAERGLTLEAQRAAAATLDAGAREAQLLRTARELRGDRPVPEEELDRAVATFEEMARRGSLSNGGGGRARPR